MPLYTDNDIVTPAFMQSVDPECLAISQLGNEMSLSATCAEAWIQCNRQLEAALQLFAPMYGQAGSQAHNMAVANVGVTTGSGTHARIRPQQIVAHDGFNANSRSQVQNWLTFKALEIFYRGASRRTAKANGDRYRDKYEDFKCESSKSWQWILQSGLPFVQAPLECPGAKHAFAAGAWAQSLLSTAAYGGSTLTATAMATLQVAVTWYDNSKYVSPANNGNGESGPSGVLPTTLPIQTKLVVSIAGLNPPSITTPDQVGISQGPVTTSNATHWNVYVGLQGGLLYLQNSTGIPVATKSYTLTGDPATSGNVMGQGQYADAGSNVLFGNLIMRG